MVSTLDEHGIAHGATLWIEAPGHTPKAAVTSGTYMRRVAASRNVHQLSCVALRYDARATGEAGQAVRVVCSQLRGFLGCLLHVMLLFVRARLGQAFSHS